MSLELYLSCDSTAICIATASDNASAKAIVRTPPITINFEFVIEFNPTIRPRVVMTPEVKPKLNPALKERFIL